MADDAKRMLETGTPPKWFPPDKRLDFRVKQLDLLIHMGLADLIATVEEIIEMRREHFAEDGYLRHECRPATINGVPDAVTHACAILARYVHAAALGEDKGLPLLLGQDHAERVLKGDKYSEHQSKIASAPRRRVGDEGETIDQIIGELATRAEYSEEGAKELWPHFYSELDERSLTPRETEAHGDWRKSVIAYDFKGGRKSITGGQFANVVSDYRTGKKSG